MSEVAERNYKGYPDPSHIVSVEEASKLVRSKSVVFVDTRNYWKYTKGHIPGAVNLELYAFHWFDTSKEGLETFAGEMGRLFGAYGIDAKKQVIFYQNDSGYDAARGVWLLEFLGNGKGRILDGGLRAWKEARAGAIEGRPRGCKGPIRPETEPGSRVRTRGAGQESRNRRSEGDRRARRRRVRRDTQEGAKGRTRAGRGERRVEASDAEGRDLKNTKQLGELYGGLPVRGQLVTYCQSGYRAADSWLVLRLLGYAKARNYLGSWYQWGNGAGTPVEK